MAPQFLKSFLSAPPKAAVSSTGVPKAAASPTRAPKAPLPRRARGIPPKAGISRVILNTLYELDCYHFVGIYWQKCVNVEHKQNNDVSLLKAGKSVKVDTVSLAKMKNCAESICYQINAGE